MIVQGWATGTRCEFRGSAIAGAVIGLGDLAYPSYRVLLRIRWGQHRSDERQFHIDISRLDAFMEESGWVIRVNKSLMQRRSTLLGKVGTALEAGAGPLPPVLHPS
jgi:hypothetical protein